MNNVTLIGNVCRPFELRQTNAGKSVASNTLAVKRDRKEDGDYVTDFFDIYCFGQTADYAVKYIRKGDKICINGSVHIRDYTTRNGSKGRAVEVIVNSIENLTPKTEDAQPDNPPVQDEPAKDTAANAQSENLDSIEFADDDLPF